MARLQRANMVGHQLIRESPGTSRHENEDDHHARKGGAPGEQLNEKALTPYRAPIFRRGFCRRAAGCGLNSALEFSRCLEPPRRSTKGLADSRHRRELLCAGRAGLQMLRHPLAQQRIADFVVEEWPEQRPHVLAVHGASSAVSANNSACKRCRARASRDMTVPIGKLVESAISR